MAEGHDFVIPAGGVAIGDDGDGIPRWPFISAIAVGDRSRAEEGGIAIGSDSKAGKGGCAIGEAVVAKDHEFIIGPWNIGELVKQGYDGSMAGLGFSCNWSGCCCDKY